MKNIINELWTDMENQNTKISKKVFNWLNKDSLNAVIVDNQPQLDYSQETNK